MSDSKEKFRPQLSATDISYIVDICRENQGDERAKSVLRKLTAMHARIRDGVAKPSYVIRSESLAESTGFDMPVIVDKKAHREALYQKWIHNPSLISIPEMDLVDTYRYENELMSPEECAEFEAKQFA